MNGIPKQQKYFLSKGGEIGAYHGTLHLYVIVVIFFNSPLLINNSVEFLYVAEVLLVLIRMICWWNFLNLLHAIFPIILNLEF